MMRRKLFKPFYVALCVSFFNGAFSQNFDRPIAILGGQGDAPYAALLSSDGSLRKVPGLPLTGLTYRVAMNASSEGLIGGTDALNAYAAFVSPEGSLTPIGGLIAPGEIYTVAINPSGRGIIGGGLSASNIPYAALVFQNGTATSISGLPMDGLIYGVALDSSGQGIIGGKGTLNSAYAALVSSSGTLTPLTGLPSTGGIFWVATNESKMRFIGGQDNTSVYAAFVTPSDIVVPISGLPLGLNYSVAINASGEAIMGGSSLNLPYAALVSPNGTVRTLNNLPNTTGIIYNVALNDSGTGLIAGFSSTGPYGTFVAPDGSLTPLIGLPAGSGFLDGAALHSSGIGIVGGTSVGAPFAALVAPNGTLTYLSGLPSQGEINTIAIASLDGLVPKSLGLFSSLANTQFTLTDVLTQHCMIHHKKNCGCEEKTTSLWLALFGNHVHEKAQHAIPSFSNDIIGTLLGVEYAGIQDVTFGGAFAYAHNDVHGFKGSNHAAINQESLVLYATFNKPLMYLNMALWGGAFQASNRRHSLMSIISESRPSGWNLSPHLELGIPFPLDDCQAYVIEPFAAFDWAHNWQSHFCERGSSGFNLKLNDQHASVFRSEIGARFYETFFYNWGCLILEEKLSYINRTPTHRGIGSASFIGAASAFDVEIFNSSSLNNGRIQVHIEAIPANFMNVYGSFDYQGEFGSSLQSNMITFTIGRDF